MTGLIPHKLHLSNLPPIRENQIPQEPNKLSQKGLVLIPIFQGTPGDHVTHHVAQSACWARRSWMLYSDAADYGIEIKLYVENKVKDDALPILEANHIPDDAIIFFDGDHMEGVLKYDTGYSTFGGKKCTSYGDYRFQEYDWIFDIDSDIFVFSYGDTLPFFRRFFESTPPDALGAYWWSKVYDPVELHWCRGADGITTNESVEAWKKRFEALAGRFMLEKYCDPNQSFVSCHGGLTSFPAKRMMTDRKDLCEFLVESARTLVSSEATLSLWHAMGNPIFDMQSLCYHVVYYRGFTADLLKNYRYRLEDARNGIPFLFHYSHSDIDFDFREAVGIMG